MKKSHGFLLLFAILVATSTWLYAFYVPEVVNEHGAVYELKPGTSVKRMVTEMHEQGIVEHPIVFALFAYSHLKTPLKTGEYLFPKGSTPYTMWKQVTNGTGFMNYPFTIVPGWTFIQLRNALQRSNKLRQLSANMSEKQIMNRLGAPDRDPEGQFFPETYYYTKDSPDLVILKRAYDLMQLNLKEAWESRAPNLPYKDVYEALIAASLIEKEAYLDVERPIIAGVLINRIRKNMLIQFDPTVIYGLGLRYNGKIHKQDLLENNPYNTYVHKGLPPTPIAMPGMISINAALHPENTDYLYFVARGDKSHQFSKTLNEHQAAVAKASTTK
jgi:UPF0755 protein